MTDTESFTRNYDRYRQVAAEANRRNKTAVFDALAEAGITAVQVDFDGEGDSGQIESVTGYTGDEMASLPLTGVPIQQARWGTTEVETTALPLSEAVEALCYAFLAEDHDGWENNDGAYGEFHLDVAKRIIELEFNGRFTDTFTETHSY